MVQQATGTLETLVQTHLEALHTSSWLTSHFREHFQNAMAVDVKPEQVIETLHNAGIKCVLMGTHAINTYRDEPRATQDVDVLVRKKDFRKAVKTLSVEFPELQVNDTPVVTRFIDPATKKVVLDVMKLATSVIQVIYRHAVTIGDTHCIPDLEMALASKFAAMASPLRRGDKRAIDFGDFMNVVLEHRQEINMSKLKQLAEKVRVDGAKEIAQLIDDIDTGRKIEF